MYKIVSKNTDPPLDYLYRAEESKEVSNYWQTHTPEQWPESG